MKIRNVLPSLLAIFTAIVFMASCEEDFGTIGSSIIGDQDVNAMLDDSKTVVSYSRSLLPVQSNGLPIYQLGVFNDPVYGSTKINLLSQVTLESPNPDFGINLVMDSVRLYIPFFSKTEIDDDQNNSFSLDSIYGNDPINISIYRSNYFLRDFDPSTAFEETQNYFSNQNELFQNFKGELITTIENFVPSNQGINTSVLPEDDDAGGATEPIITVLPPGIRVKLDTLFFKESIINMGGSSQLLNNNNFREYFRGLFFEVDGIGDNLLKLNLQNAKLDIYYTSGSTFSNGEDRSQGIATLNFNAISVNTFQNNVPGSIAFALANPNTQTGQDRLYVRGGAGAITVLELFGADNDGNGVPDQLDQLRQDKWLINDANLIFYVDQSVVTPGFKEPERLILYDLKNGNALVDYALDATSSNEPIDSYTTHLGRLQRDSEGRGNFYKIRITNYLSDLIHKDSTNVALGLIVSQNVGTPGFHDLQNVQAPGIEVVPTSAIFAHEGTVLHGNTSADNDRRLKLQIFYTETN